MLSIYDEQSGIASSNQHGDKEFIEMAENADCMLIYYSCLVYVYVYLF
jgi:hypothetical protein